MRLSKQERIAIIIILAVIILAVGVFMFIIPAAEKIEDTTKIRDNKQKDLDAQKARAAMREPLRDQILEAYEEGEHVADMFFPELKSYELDDATRAFLEQVEANIVVTGLNVTEPGTGSLSTNFPEDREVSYDLKNNATSAAQQDEAKMKRQQRLAELQNGLGASQTIGASTVTFTVRAPNQEEISKFINEINNYVDKETNTRKAIMYNGGYGLMYPEVTEKYAAYITLLDAEATKAGNQANAFKPKNEEDKFTYEMPDDILKLKDKENEKPKDEDPVPVAETYVTMDVSITFYSIVRMEDPKPQLDEQDGIVEGEEAV